MTISPAYLQTIEALKQCQAATVSDVLDELGLRNQVMAPDIRPLDTDSRFVGPATTVRATTVTRPPPGPRYQKELEAVDRLKSGQVMIVSHAEGCYFGELLSLAAKVRGVAGLVHDCYIRDLLEVKKLGLPVFVRGVSACEPYGRIAVQAFDVPVECGGVTVHPGDIIVADCDGVVVIPEHRAVEVAPKALARTAAETKVRDAVLRGLALRDIFAEFGAA